MLLGKFRDPSDLFWAVYRRTYIKLNWLASLRLPNVPSPHVVEIELTNACNMGCPHCHRSIEGRSEGFMSAAIFKKLIDELKQQPFASLRIVGLGESALHPQLHEFMSYLVQTDIKVEFTTNGELLRRYPPEQICRWPIDILGISIDGTDADSYAKFRPGGDFERLKEAVKRLYQYKSTHQKATPLVKIRNVILPGTNESMLADFRRSWLNHADVVTFNTFNPKTCSVNQESLERCDSLFFLAHVRWDGRVPLCGYQFLYTRQEYIGTLHDQSLKEIWRSKRLDEVRTRHLNKEFDQVSFCKNCFNTQCKKRIAENAKTLNVGKSRTANLIHSVFNIL